MNLLIVDDDNLKIKEFTIYRTNFLHCNSEGCLTDSHLFLYLFSYY